MKALVIGCGSIGSRRARILKQLGAEIGVYDTDESKTARLATELNLPTYYVDLDSAVLGRYDVAFICTPPSTHLDLAQRCAGAGVHLFIEKPLSNSLDKKKIAQLVYTMQVNGIIGIMGQSYRFCPSLVTWRKQFDGKSLLYGSINSGQHLSEWTPGRDYRASIYADKTEGGIVLTSLAHSLDMAQWLFGAGGGIEAITGLIANSGELGIPVDDDATLLVRMKSGAQVTIHNDFWQRPYKCEASAVTTGIDGACNATVWQMQAGDAEAMYLQETQHLMQCIERKYQGQPDLWAGVSALEWMEAAQRASDTGTWQRIENYWAELAGRK